MEDIIDKILSKFRGLVFKYKYVILVLVLISVGIYVLDYIKKDNDMQKIMEQYQVKEPVQETVQQTSNNIFVHIDGAVYNPGVYELDEKSRLNDLINMAGGMTSEAVTINVNLAKRLEDGEKIYIYSQGEEEAMQMQQESSNGKININTATKEQLMSLPGIGQATASKIVEYVKSNGKLKNKEDIKNISGIGDSKYEQIKDLIDVK